MGKVNLQLKALIITSGFPTSEDLAEATGIHPAALSRILRGRRRPSARELSLLEQRLDRKKLDEALSRPNDSDPLPQVNRNRHEH